MPIIKSANAPLSLSPFSMQDVEDQARAVLRRAQKQAEQLLAQAQVAGEQLRAQAHAQGHIDGKKDGLAKGREEGFKAAKDQALLENRQKLAELIAALTKAMGELNASRQQLESVATEDIIRLSIAIAERVTKRHGILDPTVAIANVSEALKMTMKASDVRIAIHPTQKQSLTEALPALKIQWPALAHVEVIEEAGLAPGGCRIFTREGQVNADLDGQLARVAADLLPGDAAGA